MKNRIKSYLVFTGLWYRIAVYLLAPLAMVGLGLWVEAMIGESGAGMVIVTVLLPTVEIVSDNWLFGGIQAKDSMKLEFLKTSGRGMDVYKSALWMDLLRKFLSALGTVALWLLAAGWLAGGSAAGTADGAGTLGKGVYSNAVNAYGMGVLLYFVLLTYFASTLGTFLSRFGDMLWLNMLIGYGSFYLTALGLIMLNMADCIIVIDIICAILDVFISVLAVRTAMKRMEGSYYDK